MRSTSLRSDDSFAGQGQAGVKLLIYGSKEFGKVLRDLAIGCGHDFVGYIDDLHSGSDVVGSYESAKRLHPPGSVGVVVAIGYEHLDARWRIYQRVVADGYAVPTLVHERAYVRSLESIGRGSVIMATAVVDVGATLGDLTVLWPGAVVNHDGAIGANTFVSPNATVCGYARVGLSCFIGAGAIVVDHCSVPDNSFVKAGRVFH